MAIYMIHKLYLHDRITEIFGDNLKESENVILGRVQHYYIAKGIVSNAVRTNSDNSQDPGSWIVEGERRAQQTGGEGEASEQDVPSLASPSPPVTPFFSLTHRRSPSTIREP